MKKLLSFIFLLTVGTSAFAQKSYLNIVASDLNNSDGSYLYLTGDVPSDMKDYYNYKKIGDILNQLSQKGFEVEFMSAIGTGSTSNCKVNYLLSKKSPGSSNAIQRVQADPDEEVTEVARYNLQGMPIGKNEKGIQIVVYSNYTTKTIIVE